MLPYFLFTFFKDRLSEIVRDTCVLHFMKHGTGKIQKHLLSSGCEKAECKTNVIAGCSSGTEARHPRLAIFTISAISAGPGARASRGTPGTRLAETSGVPATCPGLGWPRAERHVRHGKLRCTVCCVKTAFRVRPPDRRDKPKEKSPKVCRIRGGASGGMQKWSLIVAALRGSGDTET